MSSTSKLNILHTTMKLDSELLELYTNQMINVFTSLYKTHPTVIKGYKLASPKDFQYFPWT